MFTRWKKVRLGNLISVCPGRRHAWFESNVGEVRKPIRITNQVKAMA